MSKIDKNDFQHDFETLHKFNPFNFNFSNQSDWSPPIEKQLLEELKSPIKIKNNDNLEKKVLCLIIGVLALLSIGLCVQANAIPSVSFANAQALREIVRIYVQQTIYINNQ